LFVGNIDRSVDRRELEDFFSDEGFKVARIDLKAGFAFVFLEGGTDVEEAARTVDGKELARRPLKVEPARGDGAIKRREDQRRKVTENEPSESLFVVNFDSYKTSDRDIEKAFERYGKIERVQKIGNYAFVQFETVEQAKEAKEGMSGQRLGDRNIIVEYVDKSRKDRYDGRRERSRSPRRSRSPPRRRYRSRSPRRSRSPPRYRDRDHGRDRRRERERDGR